MLIHRGHDHWLGLALDYGALKSVSLRTIPGNYNSQSEMLLGSFGLANNKYRIDQSQAIQKWRVAMRMSISEWVASGRSHWHIQQCPDTSVLTTFQEEFSSWRQINQKARIRLWSYQNSVKKNGIHYLEGQKKPSSLANKSGQMNAAILLKGNNSTKLALDAIPSFNISFVTHPYR